MLTKIKAYEIIDHGIEHEQYFQGCGVSFTSYDDVATGMGNSYKEALDDALEQLATSGYATEELEAETINASDMAYDTCDDQHYYVSIRIKL